MTKKLLELNDKELDAVSGGMRIINPDSILDKKVTVQETCPSCGYLLNEFQKNECEVFSTRLAKCPGCGETVTPKVTVID